MPSRFLSEAPLDLIVNLGDDDSVPQVDLQAERYQVRQSAQRNTFTGKTYNSLENISQFFAERGVEFPVQKPLVPPGGAPPQPPPPPVSAAAKTNAAAPVRKSARTGMTVEHPKYGTGTVRAPRRRGRGCQDYSQLSAVRAEEAGGEIRGAEERLKWIRRTITDRLERKKLKRAARKKAAPKAKRAAGVARGSMKKKVKKMVQGQRKR